jgi:asparagine synthase (glutamine-hydrolysing)
MRVAPAWAKPWAQGPNLFALTELEVATGDVFGQVDVPPWPEEAVDGGPLDVLFDEARRILSRGRCVVAFSGGRDSSALLACFLYVARRDGFEEPTALTARWPGDAAAEESEWQDHVARELKVKHWEIITPGTDFDLLGPLATGLLRAHGLLWPAPLVIFLPMIDAAGDGVLVTGEGGDEVFGIWGMGRIWSAVRQRRRLRSAVRPVLGAAMPDWLRRRRALPGAEPYQNWLTPEAWAAQREALAAEAVAVAPLWWPDYLREVDCERGLRLAERAYASICASRGGSLATPLKSPAFLSALARAGGRLGLGDRTSVMRALFSSLLDDTILSRVSKATFGGVYWGPASREFAEDWDGTGVPVRWVDVEALRAAWRAPTPVYGTALPLHAAWLATHPDAGPGTPKGVVPL